MSGPDFERAKIYACERLTGELSPALRYHSLAHTRDDVVPAAERLAHRLAIHGLALGLLRTAAYYHDIGFVEQRDEHEAAGAAIAAAVLPGFGYTSAHITAISGMIMATRLPQTPRTLLEQALADADLDLLGRDDFLRMSLALRAELAAYGETIGEKDWYRRQLAFLQGHRYFTPTARALRDAGKQCNIALLQELIDRTGEGE